MKKKTPDKLIRKKVYYFGKYGFRGGVVKKVHATKRGVLRAVTVIADYGTRVKVPVEQLRVLPSCGVKWYGKIVPLDDWLI